MKGEGGDEGGEGGAKGNEQESLTLRILAGSFMSMLELSKMMATVESGDMVYDPESDEHFITEVSAVGSSSRTVQVSVGCMCVKYL